VIGTDALAYGVVDSARYSPDADNANLADDMRTQGTALPCEIVPGLRANGIAVESLDLLLALRGNDGSF